MEERKMTDEEMAEAMKDFVAEPELPFCQQYLKDESKFKWFIEDYFGINKVTLMHELAVNGKSKELGSEMCGIWYKLPDGRFNIMVMPQGWSEFLSLMER